MEARSLERWRWENDERALRSAMLSGVSYPEYAVILHRLRELTNKGDRDIAWEPQELGESLEADLATHPGQLRALFVEGSPFRDNIVYGEHKRLWLSERDRRRLPYEPVVGGDDVWRRFRDVADVDRDDDRSLRAAWTEAGGAEPLSDDECERIRSAIAGEVRLTDWRLSAEPAYALVGDVDQGTAESGLIERLVGVGARITENRLHIDDYHRAGKRFTLPLPGDALLHYVPHSSIGTRELERYRHSLQWTGGPEIAAAVAERITESFEAHRVEAADVLVTVDHYDRPGRPPRTRLVQRNRLGPRRREVLEAAADAGTIARLDEGGRWARHTTVLLATDERLRRFPGYYEEIAPGSFMYRRAALALERLLRAAEVLQDLSFTIEFEAEFDDPPQLGVGGAAAATAEAFGIALREALPTLGLDVDVARDVGNILSIAGVEALFEHRVTRVTRREEIVHDAPFSERGVLRVENVAPSRGLELLMELGIVRGVCPAVPYEPIYRGRHRRGRVIPWHPDYALGAAELTLPDGYAIVHGLTGVGAGLGGGALERLEQIILTGGLKSISERRRMGIVVEGTMSPVGDTGSGIDVGVSTRVSPHGAPGSTIYFVMKPTCVMRRDLFFSDRDFGGHESRYESYNAYAASIGQGKMHHVAPHAARVKHVAEGLSGSNELYLRHEIPWDEIDALIVAADVHDEVVAMVSKYQALGELPSGLGVVSLQPHSISSSISAWIERRPAAVRAMV